MGKARNKNESGARRLQRSAPETPRSDTSTGDNGDARVRRSQPRCVGRKTRRGEHRVARRWEGEEADSDRGLRWLLTEARIMQRHGDARDKDPLVAASAAGKTDGRTGENGNVSSLRIIIEMAGKLCWEIIKKN